MVRRIFVEKKQGFDIEAQAIYNDVKESLHLDGLTGIRILNRYDIEGVDEATYSAAEFTVFAEPALDVIYREALPEDVASAIFFAVEYLPGQYDQRADSAAQCIKLMNSAAEAVVKFAKIYVLEGYVSPQDVERIKAYCVNPVDSQLAEPDKPEDLKMDNPVPPPVATVDGFTLMTEKQLRQYIQEKGLAMSYEDIAFVQLHFRDKEKRNPTETEIRVIDTYWSDHCRHTTFNTILQDIQFDDSLYGGLVKNTFDEYLAMRNEVYGERVSEKPVCLMDMACIGAKFLKKRGMATMIDESEEINACSIRAKADIDGKEEDWLVMFKNETHNHPTEIEPFGGAATCLGGAIRDPLSGRVYVYQAMRVTGSANPTTPIDETLAGKLPQRKITREAAAGYSSYGNQIGLATGQVDEIYHENYVAKRMEVGAVVGAAPARHVIRKTPEAGDVIILVGGRTGRDGCGGATGSSKEHTEESISQCGAEVQKGNPPVERNLQRMFRREEVATLIKRCNDFGAGGVSVAIGELADGLDINLDLVPRKYEGLDGTELAISESQERMAVVVDAADKDKFIQYAEEENLEATAVAQVTDTNRVRMTWRGDVVLDIDRDFLNTNGVSQYASVHVKGDGASQDVLRKEKSAEELLKDLNCCSKKGLVEMFDSTIGAATVLMPLGGRRQLTPAAGMVAKLPVVQGDTDTVTIMSYGFDPDLAVKSTYHSAFYAVVDSVTRNVVMGGSYKDVYLTFQEYFEKLGKDPDRWSKPMAALLGALKAQKELGIPAIGGKDSMSGTFMDIDVPPTLISFAISVGSADRVVSQEFKQADSQLVAVYAPVDKYGIIDFDIYKHNMDAVGRLISEGRVLAADTIGRGGLYIKLIKMAAGNNIGVELEADGDIVSPMYGAVLLEVPEDLDVDSALDGAIYSVLGRTTDTGEININGESQRLDKIIEEWEKPLEDIFPVRTQEYRDGKDDTDVKTIFFDERNTASPLVKQVKPRVIIPAFPGTNCEMDSARAFTKAGAEADIHIVRNLTAVQLEDSIRELEKKIRESQIIMIPGGFSGGDEPDGSAKFITAVFRNPVIRDAVTDLLENRDGLMLGICNGFQALIKLGLVPEGRITEMSEDSPTLTYNNIGRHASCLVRTRIASVKSPWLSLVNAGDVFTIPVSHGEGRFIASPELLDRLEANGQIATQYVDYNGVPSMDIEFNPNGSAWAVEAITSPDGRVLGKMGHSERIGRNLYKNVPGEKDQRIFEAGVQYFK